MRPIVESYARHEGSKKAFCEEHDLAIHTLDYWRRKFSEQQAGASAFVALEISDTSVGRSMEVHYPNGIWAVVPLDTPVEILRTLIAAGG